MAIAYDTSSSGQTANTTNTITWNHTCTGSNLVLVVAVGADSAAEPTGVTYNTVALTKAQGATTGLEHSIWYLASPATGTNSVVVTFAANHHMAAGAVSISGCNTASPVDTSNITNGTSATPSIGLTTNNANSFIVCGVTINDNPAITADAPATKRFDELLVIDNFHVAGSTRTTTTAGLYTPSWTLDGAGHIYGICGIAINEATGGGGGTLVTRKTLTGVGI